MNCEHCGTEHALGADYVCRDVLKTQLAIETKRAEEAGREREKWMKHNTWLTNHSVQNGQARDEAEAKLAAAVVTLRWYVRGKVDGGVCAYDTLLTLGIDPSKDPAPTECKHCRIASSIVGWPCPFCHRPNREPAGDTQETQAAEGGEEVMKEDTLKIEQWIRVAEECGYQRGLAERDAELATTKAANEVLTAEDRRLRETLVRIHAHVFADLTPDTAPPLNRLQMIAVFVDQALAASAPAGEQEKTSEGDVGREDHSSAPNSTSPPAEAPQESGVPSGIPTCDDCGEEFDPMFGVCRNVLHKRRAPGTLLGEYERMAREWIEDYVDSVHRVASLAALLARVADERQSAIVEALRGTTALADWIASNAWLAALAAARKETP